MNTLRPSDAAPGPLSPCWSEPRDSRPASWAFVVIAASACTHVWFGGKTELSPQEAYYWQYARHLDLSYFDHPPLAAWTIRAFVELLGTTERAVRAAAVAHSVVFASFLFLAGRRLFGPRVALVALVTALVTPLFSLGQVVITPDDPLLVGWAAALYFTIRALQEGRGVMLLAAGAATGFAALGKYTGWLLAPQILAVLALDARGRRFLRTPWPYAGLAIAFALFAPVLVWNSEHAWASFAFQFTRRGAGLATPGISRFLRFVGLQCVLVTPVLLAVLVWAMFAGLRRDDERLRICAVFALPTLALFALVAPFAWVKGNWMAPAYPSALLAATALLWRPGRSRRVHLAAAAVGAVVTAYLHAGILFDALPFPARDVTTAGWEDLATRVDAERHRIGGPSGEPSFVIGCGYKVASELAFYLHDHPQTFSSNAFRHPGLAYEQWFDPKAIAGAEGVVVVDRRERKECEHAAEVCTSFVPVSTFKVQRGAAEVTTFELWRCRYPLALGGAPRRPAESLVALSAVHRAARAGSEP
jgi:4-amino-4-deoxy-L-arabinose transferase-like glycosyltransferase